MQESQCDQAMRAIATYEAIREAQEALSRSDVAAASRAVDAAAGVLAGYRVPLG